MPRDAAERGAGLQFEAVGHAYDGKPVLYEVSFAVGAGELVCLVGPSGCGKTTLLRLAAGVETLQQGRILIDAKPVAEPGQQVPPERRGVGLLFQDFALFPHLSIAANVGFGLARLGPAERTQRVREVLERVGMADYAEAYPHVLSGGQQQRVALARALAPAPRVMLLDEPFSGLDTTLREQIRDDTLHVLKSAGVATLMVTHDPEEAMFMADRIAVMRTGRVEQIGRPLEIYRHPASAFVAGLYGQVNTWPGRVAEGRVDTPFGTVAAPDLPAETPVTVLIRPEGLRIEVIAEGHAISRHDRYDHCAAARVVASRLIGRSSWLHLRLTDGSPERPSHFHARVPGQFLPAEGAAVEIRLDPSQAFVFADNDPI